MSKNTRPRVLIVDDCPVNQALLSKFLERLGVSYSCASDGLEAIEQFRKQPVDIILMDCHMPIYNGYTTTAEIRSSFEIEHLKVIAVTSDSTPHNKNMCELCGMDAILLKPVDFCMVESLIEGTFTDYFLTSAERGNFD